MFKDIEDLPGDVLGIKLSGKITHEDYRDYLIPKAENLIKAYGSAKILCVVDDEWAGYELEAMWDDTEFGIKHWSEFSHMAIVSDIKWIRAMATIFTPLMPGEVKIFKLAELESAKSWITEHSIDKAA